MERRYFIATLALVATFAIFSQGFQSGHMADLACPRAALKAEIACAKRYLADRLVAKVRPFVDRGVPEEQQMVAELNLPVLAAANERIAETQAQVAQLTAEKNCEAAMRAQEQAMRAQEVGFRAQERNLRAAERVAEINVMMQERTQDMNLRAAQRAQEVSARAMARAQRALQKSQWKMVQPNAPFAPAPPVAPLPIDFQVSFPADFDQQIHAAVESRVVVKCVRAQAAAQQFRTVMVQRANQNMKNNVQVVVSSQDVSGWTALTQSPASQSAIHELGRSLQRLEDHVARAWDRAFDTL